jgi:hypothetical protein
MNPFLEIPLVRHLEKPMTIKTRNRWFGKKTIQFTDTAQAVITGRVLPGEIVAHYPDENNHTVLLLRSGATVTTMLSPADVDAARQVYDQMMKKNPGRNENLQIVRKPEQATQETTEQSTDQGNVLQAVK